MTNEVAIATWALVVVTASSTIIYAILTYRNLSIMKRDRERTLIVEITKNVIIPILNSIKEDKSRFDSINVNSFLDFLLRDFGIPNYIFKTGKFDSFAKREYLLKIQILGYNKRCSKINQKINQLKADTEQKKIVHSAYNGRNKMEIEEIHDTKIMKILESEGLNQPGKKKQREERYESEIMKILESEGLNKQIEDIKNTIKTLGNKAEKLILKLEGKIKKLKSKYYLSDADLAQKRLYE